MGAGTVVPPTGNNPGFWRGSDLVQGFVRVGLCPRKKGFTGEAM